ncbi:MAG: TlpA family protein disulfide reductase [Deltaproteobacteria bacterium]|nr:TlpA family protein disulfide reductase [Deltaproteobacteria bacterium]
MSLRFALAVSILTFLSGSAAADPLQVETLDGEPVLLQRREQDRVMIVHFWATWCPECLEELPELVKGVSRCAGLGVRLLVVDVGEDRETIVTFLRENGLELDVLRDPRGRVWRELSGFGLPMNVIWTAEGRRVEVGPRDASTWQRELETAGCAG